MAASCWQEAYKEFQKTSDIPSAAHECVMESQCTIGDGKETFNIAQEGPQNNKLCSHMRLLNALCSIPAPIFLACFTAQ